MTSRHSTLSALLFAGTPPVRSLTHERSSTSTLSESHMSQHMPESAAATTTKGALHSTGWQVMPWQGSSGAAESPAAALSPRNAQSSFISGVPSTSSEQGGSKLLTLL